MLFKIFLAFFKVGILSFGGGLAAISIIQDEIVGVYQWITPNEFADLITIAQMTPGPIAINLATFVGMKLLGFKGAVVATLGCISPSIIIVSTLSYIYYKYKNLAIIKNVLKYLRPVIIGIISYAGIVIFKIMIKGEGISINYVGLIIFAVAFIMLRKFKTDPVKTMITCGVVGMLVYKIVDMIGI